MHCPAPVLLTPLFLQVADRIAAQTGALVVLADLLGPPASHPEGAVQLRALPGYCRAAGYWQMNKWPVVKQRKIAYTEWYTAGEEWSVKICVASISQPPVSTHMAASPPPSP